MKNSKFLCFLTLLAFVFITFSCNKSEEIIANELNSNNEDDKSKGNEATWISGDENAKWLFFKLTIKIGHTAADCGNKCVKVFGEFGHIDCRGLGNVCNHTTTATLHQNEGGFFLVLEDPDIFGDDLDYYLPDRTLRITNPQNNTELWLNIPEQELIRLNNGLPFEIVDIWFSENPELENK